MINWISAFPEMYCVPTGDCIECKTGVAGAFSGFRWDFGDGSPIITNKDSVVHVFKNAGSYRVTLKANALSEGYCPVEKVSSVVIHKTPGAGIRVEPAARGCAPDTVRFIRVFQGEETNDPAEQVYWDFRNGVTAASNDVDGVVFELPGEYKVLLKVTSGAGCVGSDSVSVMTLKRRLPDLLYPIRCSVRMTV